MLTSFVGLQLTLMPDATRNKSKIACPICREIAEPAWQKSGFQLYECTRCTHLFCNAGEAENYIESTYGDDYFDGGGGGYSDYLEHRETLVAQGRKYGRMLKQHTDPGRLLDVGAAAGFLLKGICEEGWKGEGVEPNASMANFANRIGMKVSNTSFEDFKHEGTFDAATLIQVISHVRDPKAFLQQTHDLLAPSGLLLIETWNRKSLTTRLIGKNWHQYNPPSVLHWYTKKEMAALLESVGMKVIAFGRPTKWISIGNGVSLLRHSVRESSVLSLLTAPLAIVHKSLKAPYFMDDVFWVLARRVE